MSVKWCACKLDQLQHARKVDARGVSASARMQHGCEMRFLGAERGDCGVGLTWMWGLQAELRQSRNRCDGLQGFLSGAAGIAILGTARITIARV